MISTRITGPAVLLSVTLAAFLMTVADHACAAPPSSVPKVQSGEWRAWLDSPGGDFWDPEADGACFEAIKQNLKPDISVVEMDHNINDPEFSSQVAGTLLGLLEA